MATSTLERESTRPGEELHLLLQLESLRDENSRSRMREAAWISIILHLVFLFSVRELPRLLPKKEVTLVTPQEMMKQRDLTYLEQPADLQKVDKPPETDKISDKDRIASSRNPQIDKSVLERLARAGREGAPGVSPSPAPPTPPQVAQNQQQAAASGQSAQAPQRTEQQPQQSARLEPPAVTRGGGFRTSPSVSASTAIEQAARASAQSRGGGIGGEYGGGPGRANTSVKSDMEILTDTMGVDFSPYLQRVLQSVRTNWYNLIPEVARPPLMKQGNTYIEFVITKTGGIQGMRLSGPSGDVSLDRAAWGGITASNPFPPLPTEFKGEYIALRFRFMYNPDRSELR